MPKGTTLVAGVMAALCAWAGAAWACAPRASVPGHWEWQGNGHVWVPAHPTLARSAYARDDVVLAVRDVAHDRDQRDAHGQPRDLDRRVTR